MATSIPDIDLPPSFPLAHSAQRASSSRDTAGLSSGSQAKPPAFTVSGPTNATRPGNAASPSSGSSSSSSSSKVQALRDVLGTGSGSSGASLAAPTSATLAAPSPASSSLMPPPSTSRQTAPPGVGGAPTATASASSSSSSSLMPAPAATSKRKKVTLTPGHSPLDWARLKSSIQPPFPFRKIPLSEVKQHKDRNSPGGVWTVLNGKVYDMAPYLAFHPGGEDELMRVAGRDGTRLFMLTHSWVNVDAIVDACCIGIAVKDD